MGPILKPRDYLTSGVDAAAGRSTFGVSCRLKIIVKRRFCGLGLHKLVRTDLRNLFLCHMTFPAEGRVFAPVSVTLGLILVSLARICGCSGTTGS